MAPNVMLTEEEQHERWPLAFRPVREVGTGIVWLPTDLNDSQLQETLDFLNHRKKEKRGARGDNKVIGGLVQEKERREYMKMCANNGVQPASPPGELPDELIITIADSAGNIWGEVVAYPRTFKTGSTGYYGADKVKDSKRRRHQVAINIVKIGSRVL